jgi:hypothetical protein
VPASINGLEYPAQISLAMALRLLGRTGQSLQLRRFSAKRLDGRQSGGRYGVDCRGGWLIDDVMNHGAGSGQGARQGGQARFANFRAMVNELLLAAD